MKAQGTITRAVVIQDDKTGGTVLLGVAEYKDMACNFRVPFDWLTLDYDGFIKDLKEKLAQDLDCPASKFYLPRNMLFDRMSYYHQQLNGSVH